MAQVFCDLRRRLDIKEHKYPFFFYWNEMAISLPAQNTSKLLKAKYIAIMELAFRIEADYSQISRMERGKINFKISVLFDIAEALEIEPARLFDKE
jgi:hypothetical protein